MQTWFIASTWMNYKMENRKSSSLHVKLDTLACVISLNIPKESEAWVSSSFKAMFMLVTLKFA